MLRGFFVYDADAHVMVSQRMWEDMPEPIRLRRPRPVRIEDHGDLGGLESSWFIEVL